jgi:hypothetical protein
MVNSILKQESLLMSRLILVVFTLEIWKTFINALCLGSRSVVSVLVQLSKLIRAEMLHSHAIELGNQLQITLSTKVLRYFPLSAYISPR